MPKEWWKNKPGRPIDSWGKLNDITVGKIIDILRIDGTIDEACAYAGINPDTHYEWIKQKKCFSEKINKVKSDWSVVKELVVKLYSDAIKEAKQYPFILARKALFKAITSGNDKKALDFLERRDQRYKPKQENDHKWIPTNPWVVILPSNNRDTAWQNKNKKLKK